MILRSAVVLLLAAVPRPQQEPCRNPAVSSCTPALVAQVRRLGAVFDSLAALPTPRDASATDRPEAVRFGGWLRDASGRIAAHAALAHKSAAIFKGSAARIDYQAATAALRNRLLAEADKFTFTSGGLTARHEMAMNAIRNLK